MDLSGRAEPAAVCRESYKPGLGGRNKGVEGEPSGQWGSSGKQTGVGEGALGQDGSALGGKGRGTIFLKSFCSTKGRHQILLV